MLEKLEEVFSGFRGWRFGFWGFSVSALGFHGLRFEGLGLLLALEVCRGSRLTLGGCKICRVLHYLPNVHEIKTCKRWQLHTVCYVQLLRLLGGLTNFRYGLPSVTGQGLMHCKGFKLQVWFSSHGMVCKP